MYQIIFNSISSAEMSALPKLLQLEILDEFQIFDPNFIQQSEEKFGIVQQGSRKVYRYRAKDYRIYFELTDGGLLIDRVLHKNTVKDFLYRSKIPLSEDETLQKNPKFWALMDESKSKPT